jgi:hypothetical protein
MTKIETFAEQHKTESHKRRPNHPGRRGHLYFDGAELCLTVLDGKPAIPSKWKALGGRLWMGDISKNAQGVRVQDVKITGIPLENARLAIRMCRIKPKRIMSEAQKAAAAAGLEKARRIPRTPRPEHPFGPSVDSHPDTGRAANYRSVITAEVSVSPVKRDAYFDSATTNPSTNEVRIPPIIGAAIGFIASHSAPVDHMIGTSYTYAYATKIRP